MSSLVELAARASLTLPATQAIVNSAITRRLELEIDRLDEDSYLLKVELEINEGDLVLSYNKFNFECGCNEANRSMWMDLGRALADKRSSEAMFDADGLVRGMGSRVAIKEGLLYLQANDLTTSSRVDLVPDEADRLVRVGIEAALSY